MHPTLPLTRASIRDLCESLDYLLTEGYEKDKRYPHNEFAVYTYDNQSIVLADTTKERTLRLCVTVNVKKSVIIKDISGQAHINPLTIILVQGEDVLLAGNPERQFKLYCPYGAVELSALRNAWTFTVPRSTCISMRGYRLPQNLNLALPPPVGAARQTFDSLAYFPARMAGKDIVTPAYNGFSASVHAKGQIAVPEPATSGFTSLFSIPDPPTDTGTLWSDLSIVKDTTLAIGDPFPDLASALSFLAKKTITPGVTVTIAFPAKSALSGLVQINHPQGSQIILKGLAPRLFYPARTSVFSAIPGEVLLDVQVSPGDYPLFNVGDVLLVDQTSAAFRHLCGAWRVTQKIPQEGNTNIWHIRIRITDYGLAFPNVSVQPGTSRWRLASSHVTLFGGAELKIHSSGVRIYDLAFVGEARAANALSLYAHTVLDTVALSGFTGSGISTPTAKAVLDVGDLFSCSNAVGVRLERGATLNANQLAPGTPPKSTAVYLSGNSDCGLAAKASRSYFNPLYANGNAQRGVSLEQAAISELSNSFLLNNGGFGLYAAANSLASGSFNTVKGNGEADIKVADEALVKMSTSSAIKLGSENQLMNEDGSRIDIA